MNDISIFHSDLLDELKNLRILHEQHESVDARKAESSFGGVDPASKTDKLDRVKLRRKSRRETSRREETKRSSTLNLTPEPDGWEAPDGSVFTPPKTPASPGNLCWADDESCASPPRRRDSGISVDEPEAPAEPKDSVAAAEAEWTALKKELDEAYNATRELDEWTHKLFTRAASFKRQYPEDAPRLIGRLDRDLYDWQGEVSAKYAFRKKRTRFREFQSRHTSSTEKMMTDAMRRLKEARARHEKVAEEIETLQRIEKEVAEKIRRLKELQPPRWRSKSNKRPPARPAENE